MNKKKSADVNIIPKSDIRQLIRVAKPQTQRIIDHPHARYNQLGRISCILCGIQIKSEFAWTAHILSKSHKQNESRGIQLLSKRPNAETKPSDEVVCKIVKVEDKVEKKTAEKNSDPDQHNKKLPTIASNEKICEKNPAEKKIESQSQLPEGFFDDRYKDAKVRCVPYKDKMAEELELFQKEMIALEKHSEEIMEKESEVAVSERNLAEINEQIMKWEKIKQLENEKDLYEMRLRKKLIDSSGINQLTKTIENHRNIMKKEEQSYTEDDDDEDNISDELNDFRTKNTI
uniref:Zinc finger protein 830 n=1 Tax=Schistosoma japonicum TaxID=6182 RepID=Q5DAT1_SCHJA|nr:SJCHGC01117 protein [Schistosoma japonicum]